MQNLHHSDIVTHALTRLAAEYARDKQEALVGLRRRVNENITPARLGEGRSGPPAAGEEFAVHAPRPDGPDR
jgi:hypothetical protein